MKKKPRTYMMEEDNIKKIDKKANINGLKKSAIVNKAVRKYLGGNGNEN